MPPTRVPGGWDPRPGATLVTALGGILRRQGEAGSCGEKTDDHRTTELDTHKTSAPIRPGGGLHLKPGP